MKLLREYAGPLIGPLIFILLCVGLFSALGWASYKAWTAPIGIGRPQKIYNWTRDYPEDFATMQVIQDALVDGKISNWEYYCIEDSHEDYEARQAEAEVQWTIKCIESRSRKALNISTEKQIESLKEQIRKLEGKE